MLCRTGQEYGYGPQRGFAARQNRVRALRAVPPRRAGFGASATWIPPESRLTLGAAGLWGIRSRNRTCKRGLHDRRVIEYDQPTVSVLV